MPGKCCQPLAPTRAAASHSLQSFTSGNIPPQTMGKGGEGRQVPVKDGLMKRISSSGKLKSITSVADDLLVLKSIWFNKASGDDHAERLESFYGPQAEACKLLPAMPVCSDWHAPPLGPLR